MSATLHALRSSCKNTLSAKQKFFDGVPMQQAAQPSIQVENVRTKVTEWRFTPGAATGHHIHQYDYVIVPLTAGKLKQLLPDGSEIVSELTPGRCYFRTAGVEHDVINVNDYEFAFVEIELK